MEHNLFSIYLINISGSIGILIFLFQEEIVEKITGNLLLTVMTALIISEIFFEEKWKKFKNYISF